MDGQVRVAFENHLLTVVIDRPQKKNCFTVGMYAALVDALERAKDDKVRAVLLYGEGHTFSSGNDIVDFINTPLEDETHPVMQFLHAMADCEKPLVAAVDGLAVGIGTTLLLHCDMVIAAERARFRMPFVPLGVVPEGGSSLLLPQMMGLAKASELLLLGEFFSSEHAQRVGIVNEVVEDDQLLTRAREIANKFTKLPQVSLRKAKQLIRHHNRDAIQKAISEEGKIFAAQLAGPEAKEAMQAFLEKRAPKFS